MALPCCVAFVVAVADHHLPTSAPGSRPTLSSTRSCIRLGAVLPRAIHRAPRGEDMDLNGVSPNLRVLEFPRSFKRIQMDVPGSWFLSHAHFYSRTINLSRAVLPYLIWVSFSQWASNPSGCLDVSTPNSWSDRPSTAAEASTWARGRSEVICLCNFLDPNNGPAGIHHLS